MEMFSSFWSAVNFDDKFKKNYKSLIIESLGKTEYFKHIYQQAFRKAFTLFDNPNFAKLGVGDMEPLVRKNSYFLMRLISLVCNVRQNKKARSL